MQQEMVLKELERFILQDVLKGKRAEIDSETPLLETGILNSMEVIQTVKFIQDKFDVKVPATEVTGQNFENLRQISGLVITLSESNQTGKRSSQATG